MTKRDHIRETIRAFLARTGVSERALSLRAGLNDKAVQQILSGKSRNQRGDTMQKLAEAMDMDVRDLLMPNGFVRPEADFPPELPANTVVVRELDVRPLSGGGASDAPLDGEGNHLVVAHWTMPADYLRSHVAEPDAVRILRVAGESMEPEYRAGDRVIVDTSHTVPSPDGVYVLHDGFGLVLKRVEILHGSSPPTIRISSNHPAFAPYERPLADVRINGRVVGRWLWR